MDMREGAGGCVLMHCPRGLWEHRAINVQASVEMVSMKRSGQRMPQRIGEPMVSWNSRLFSPEQGNDDFWDRRKADQVAGWEKSNDDFCFWCVDLKRNYPVVENVTTSRPCWTSFCETVPSFLTPCETYSNF